jgi:hypothetical protein
MDSIVFRLFGVLFKFVGVLIVGGTIASALFDIQQKALSSHRTGLISLVSINRQLVGSHPR